MLNFNKNNNNIGRKEDSALNKYYQYIMLNNTMRHVVWNDCHLHAATVRYLN